MTSSDVLVIERRPGLAGQGVVLGMTLLAVTALFLGWGPTWAFVGVTLATLIYAGVVLHRLRHPAMPRLELGEDRRALLIDRRGRKYPATLHGQVFVSPWLSCFTVRATSGESHRICLFRDDVPADDYRRLAARLRGLGG